MTKIRRILITASPGRFVQLERWCEAHSISLITTSFIQLNPIKNIQIPTTDWIFFSSPKSVRVYLEHYSIRAKKIGTLSTGTAKELKECGHTPHFIGNSNDSTEAISSAFRAIVKNESVFFPLGNLSRKKILSAFDPKQIQTEIIYHTEIHTKEIASADIDLIIATSPSNAEGVFRSIDTINGKDWLAWGATTEHALRDKITSASVHALSSYDEMAIIAFLEKHTKS